MKSHRRESDGWYQLAETRLKNICLELNKNISAHHHRTDEGSAGPAGRRVAGQRHPGALAPLHVAHAHHHRTDEAQPRRGGEAARRGALRAAPLLPPLQPGQQGLRDAAWLNSANLAPWRRFMWPTLTTTAPTKRNRGEAARRRGSEARGAACCLPGSTKAGFRVS